MKKIKYGKILATTTLVIGILALIFVFTNSNSNKELSVEVDYLDWSLTCVENGGTVVEPIWSDGIIKSVEERQEVIHCDCHNGIMPVEYRTVMNNPDWFSIMEDRCQPGGLI